MPPSPAQAEAALDMGTTTEKMYPYLGNIRFPSLGDDCLMPQPVSVKACDVPLSPSPPPGSSVGSNNGKKCPDLKNTGITFPDEDIELKHPKQLSPLLASPPPADKLACSCQSQEVFPPASHAEMPYVAEKKYQDLSMIAFPCLD